MRLFRRPLTPFTVFLILAFTGCAVVTIDVDVYKGTLTNHKEVQLEQMFALASAAKPMLIELRDELEWGAQAESCREKAIRHGWYQEGYVQDLRLQHNRENRSNPAEHTPCATCIANQDHHFGNSVARRVNAVLSLYEDLQSDQNFLLRNRIQAQWARLQASEGRLNLGNKEDKELIDTIFTLFKNSPTNGKSTNESYDILRRPEALRELISSNNSIVESADQASALIRVQHLAQNYNDSRLAIEELLDLCLQLISLEHAEEGQCQEALPLAQLTAQLLDPPFIIWVAELESTPACLRQDLHWLLKRAIPEHILSKPAHSSDKDARWTSEDYSEVRQRLAITIAINPRRASQALRMAQTLAKLPYSSPAYTSPRSYASTIPNADLPYWGNNIRRRYGITTLPRYALRTKTGEERILSPRIQSYQRFQQASSNAMGFEGGRSLQGLEAQIRAYITAIESGDADQAGTHADRLVDSLVGFSQKVLFLANNDELLTPPSAPAFVPQILYTIWHHLAGGTLIQLKLKETFFAKSGGIGEERRNYTSVLQAVGNSILVQADEYQKRAEFEDGEQDRVAIERNAILNLAVSSKREYIGVIAESLAKEGADSADQGQILKAKVKIASNSVAHSDKRKEETAEKYAVNLMMVLGAQYGLRPFVVSRVVSKGSSKTLANEMAKASSDYDKNKKTHTKLVSDLAKQQANTFALQIATKRVGQYRTIIPPDNASSARAIRSARYDLISHLSTPGLSETPQAKSERESTLGVVANRGCSIAVISAAEISKIKSPREVLDHLLGTLHHRYTQAMLKNGENSTDAKRLLAAYRSALARRASLVRLRPSSAFLKTSYPSTTLQEDPGLGWTNGLRQQGLRSLPFADTALGFLNPNAYPAGRIQAGIDKQFWQNINRVRVSGTGKSNYVIAKDDTGNWYVKSYSANPQVVLKSARNLGMLALGNKMDADVLLRTQNNDAKSEGETASPTAQEASTLGRLADRHKQRYLEAILKEKTTMTTEVTGSTYTDRIKAIIEITSKSSLEKDTWLGHLKTSSKLHLQSSFDQLANEVDLTDGKADNDQALPHVLGALDSLIALHSSLDHLLEAYVNDARKKYTESSEGATVALAKKDIAEAAHKSAEADLTTKSDVLTKAQAALAQVHSAPNQTAVDQAQAEKDTATQALTNAKRALDTETTAAESAATKANSDKDARDRGTTVQREILELGRTYVGAKIESLEESAMQYQSTLDIFGETVRSASPN